MRGKQQASVGRDAEGGLEVRGRAAPLVVGQAEADDAPARVLGSQPSERAGVERVPGAVRGDDDPDADARRLLGVPGGVQEQVGEVRDAAVDGGVARGVGLQTPPARLGPLVLGDLHDEAAEVLFRLDDRPGRVVQPLEPEPAALVGGGQLRRPFLGERRWQAHAAQLGQLDHGRMAHRPGQVQVKVRLGKRRQVLGSAAIGKIPGGCRPGG